MLVGKTSRGVLSDEIASLGLFDYLIGADEGRVVIAGGSDYALTLAVDQFLELLSAERVSLPIVYQGKEGGDGAVEIKVGSFNIKHGEDVGLDYSVLAGDIVSAGLDICGLQEVDENTTRNGGQDTMKALSEASGYEYYKFAKSIDFQGGGYGTGILSKYPILSFEVVMLESDGYEQRTYGHAVIDVKGTKIDFYNTHLSYENAETRAKQFGKIADELAKKDRWILTADFNTENFTEFEVIKDAVLVNNSKTRMLSFAGQSAIDNIVCPSGTVVLSYGIENKTAHSDHYMIRAQLLIR